MRSFFLILIFALLFPLQSFAATGITKYYHYDNKTINISKESFRRYAKPQLRSMLIEFFHIMEKLEPINKSLIKIKKQVQVLRRSLSSWQQKCLINSEDDCSAKLSALYKEARQLDDIILEVQQKNSILSNIFKSKKVENYLNLTQILDELSNDNYLLLHYLEEYSLTSDTPFYSHRESTKHFYKLMKKMVFNSEMILTILLDKNHREDFDNVWSNFFKIVEDRVIYKNDRTFLISRLEELNAVWNTFHMKVTKGRSEPLPNNLIIIVKIMHNRWNSILKIILRT